MDFSNVITNAGSICFSHDTDSQGNFMDAYNTRSRGPQNYSTDLQLFMITGIDHDNDESSAVTSSVTTATTTATTVSSTKPVTIMDIEATMTTSVGTTVTATVGTNYLTSIPDYQNVVMHDHPIVNDRLLMFRKFNWIRNVNIQMFEESWKRTHDPYTPVNMHEIVSWYEMLTFQVIMEEEGVLNYNLPVNPPLHVICTYLYMKPMVQLFIYDLTKTLMYSRTLWCETDNNISDVREREDESGCH